MCITYCSTSAVKLGNKHQTGVLLNFKILPEAVSANFLAVSKKHIWIASSSNWLTILPNTSLAITKHFFFLQNTFSAYRIVFTKHKHTFSIWLWKKKGKRFFFLILWVQANPNIYTLQILFCIAHLHVYWSEFLCTHEERLVE